jgi:hypothetical protein
MTRRACLFTLACLVAVQSAAAFAEPLQGSRIRPLGAGEKRLVRSAMDQSATVRELVARIERSDLIVMLRFGMLSSQKAGTTELLSVVPGTRFLLVTLDPRAIERDRLARLGHELRHVVELADATEVRNATTMRELFERIGWPSSGPDNWETAQAVEAGRLVVQDLDRGNTRHVADLARLRERERE